MTREKIGWCVSYFDGVAGTDRVFDSEGEAIAFAEYKWSLLTRREKIMYSGADDYGGYFIIQKGNVNTDDWTDAYDVAFEHRDEVPGWFL